MLTIELFLVFVICVMAAGLVISFSNNHLIKRFDDYDLNGESPFVSILVPARNEEDNIEACPQFFTGLRSTQILKWSS